MRLLLHLLTALPWRGQPPGVGGRARRPGGVAALRRSENLLRSGSSIATYRMTVTRPEWSRTMRFLSHDDRPRDRFRMEVLEPSKIKGTLFLKMGNRLSMYLPKLEREIAISPVMMQDPWMGSDFNNQDLLEASALLTSYVHRVVAREGSGSGAVLTIESSPKEGVAVVWGRLRQRVRTDGVPVAVEYLDAQGAVARRVDFDEVRELAADDPHPVGDDPGGQAGPSDRARARGDPLRRQHPRVGLRAPDGEVKAS